MSYWNYRLVKRRDGLFGVHEVHYNASGEAYAMTENCVSVGPCDSAEEVRADLIMINADAKRRPLFTEPETWPERT